ncbi:MAG: hypothetical protein FWD19_00290, partial [Defluviitaleaceae bacterium]|nr:hypothetical protein [Defluviitaleaceae bacterium]
MKRKICFAVMCAVFVVFSAATVVGSDSFELPHFGVTVEGENISVHLESQGFYENEISAFTMLPIEEMQIQFPHDFLSAKNLIELSRVKVSEILDIFDFHREFLGLPVSQNETVVFWNFSPPYDHSHEILKRGDTVDLSRGIFDDPVPHIRAEFIVGSTSPLDRNNIRYTVTITIPAPLPDIISSMEIFELGKSEIFPANSRNRPITDYFQTITVPVPEEIPAIIFDVKLNLHDAYKNAYTVKAVEGGVIGIKNGLFNNNGGKYFSREEVWNALQNNSSLDVAEKIFGGFQIPYNPNARVVDSNSAVIGLVFEENGEMIYYQDFVVRFATQNKNGVLADALYNDNWEVVSSSHTYRREGGVDVIEYELFSDFSANEKYFTQLFFTENNLTVDSRDFVKKVVVGHFDSFAAAQPDIKDLLFTENSSTDFFKTDFSRGQDFTVFTETEIFKITLATRTGERERPERLEFLPAAHALLNEQTFFNITSVNGTENIYILDDKLLAYHGGVFGRDTYANLMGFHTIFSLDASVDSSAVVLNFDSHENSTVFYGRRGAAGKKIISGETEIDFSGGLPLQFSVVSGDGLAIRNFWVEFVPQHTNGSKLFVHGIKNPLHGARRELFLTTRHVLMFHDIFIANTGNAPLTGISAELRNAKNVKLDPYWRIDTHDTLSAFENDNMPQLSLPDFEFTNREWWNILYALSFKSERIYDILGELNEDWTLRDFESLLRHIYQMSDFDWFIACLDAVGIEGEWSSDRFTELYQRTWAFYGLPPLTSSERTELNHLMYELHERYIVRMLDTHLSTWSNRLPGIVRLYGMDIEELAEFLSRPDTRFLNGNGFSFDAEKFSQAVSNYKNEIENSRTNSSLLSNFTKIRLLPDGGGAVSGTLVISANGLAEPIQIELADSESPVITTTTLPHAVKFVPYGLQIMHDNKYPWNSVTLEIVSGVLPDGVELKPTGELYGAPREYGEFNFAVRLRNSDRDFSDSTVNFALTVLENTNENVFAATDKGYEITTHIGTASDEFDFVVTEIPSQGIIFVSAGAFGEFFDLWLNGEKLTRDVDYTAEDGSTVIAIREQTLGNIPAEQRTIGNTLAAEFRAEGNNLNDVRRASQNFRIDTSGTGNNNTIGGGRSTGGGGSNIAAPVRRTETENENENENDDEENSDEDEVLLNHFVLRIGSPLITDLTGNAQTQTMDVVPMIQNGRTLLPVR